MDVCAITANLGNFDKRIDPVKQSIPYDFHRITDEEFPPRQMTMTPRLQARIVKMFSWQMVPGYEIYLWVDASCALVHEDSVKWFVDKLGDADLAVFKHPHRETIQEEGDYIKQRLAINCPYITPRYKNELIDEQLAEINEPDLPLYASTAYIYRDSEFVREMLKDWWYHTSRYHSVDQLSLSHVIKKHALQANVIPDNYLKCKYLKHVRK